jgi:hypothetical protein
LLIGAASAGGCSERRQPVEPVTVPNPTFGAVTVAVAPAVNLSGSTAFDANRVADLMAGELMHAERVSVIPVSRVLAVLSAQGTDRVQSPTHAGEIAAQVGAEAILVFAVTEYDPYDPPSLAISAQLFAADPPPTHRAPRGDPGTPVSQDAAHAGGAGHVLAQTQQRFDASHADVVDDIRGYARLRSADESPYGWRRYVVSQQHFIEYCCYATVRGLLNGQSRPLAGSRRTP